MSHTFFLNEVIQLQKLGLTIDTASINNPDRDFAAMSAIEQVEAQRTLYIKSGGAKKAISSLLDALLHKPSVLVRGLSHSLRLGNGSPSATLKSLFYAVEALILGSWMRKHGHSHLHVHFGGPVASVALLCAQMWDVSYSITIHGPDEFFDIEKFHLSEKISQAAMVLCISNYCRSQLMRITNPVHWDKMHVVHLGVDPALFVPAIKSNANDVVQIACVGRLVPAKGQMILLKACLALRTKGVNFHLRMVGNGTDRHELEAFAQEHSLPVTFEGSRTHAEILEFLNVTDIFVLASFAEGVPVALMEAMSMQVPCVSTKIAGIPELIRDGIDGFLVSASAVDELENALERLIADSALRSKFGKSAREQVLNEFNLPKNAQLLADTFAEFFEKGA